MSLAQTKHDHYWQNEHAINFFDYERNPPLLKLFKPGEKVLDVGCGDGAVAHYLSGKLNLNMVGVDFSITALERAKHRRIDVVQTNIDQSLPFQAKTFDTVFFGDVIEHIYNPQTALQEIHRIIKPSGHLVLSCPNMAYWRYRLHYLLTGMFPETEWIEQELWQSQHIRFFNQKLLYKLLNQLGFKPTKFIGISRRRLDQPLLNIFPQHFGMIMLVVAQRP